MKSSSGDRGGELILIGLAILFIVLKLTGDIDWPWLWVLCPIWIAPAFVLAAYVLILGIAGIVCIVPAIVLLFAFVFMIIVEAIENARRDQKGGKVQLKAKDVL